MFFSGLICAVTAALMWSASGPVMRIAGSLGVEVVVLNLEVGLLAGSRR
ncbi:MAG: hypothetical protein Q7I97_04145 [Thermovirgaceae bacterium]|nr:hypothetical protein [Thermovirgaceae bacterium]